jgi:RimJ/RimL family protein N-acetyltransferase
MPISVYADASNTASIRGLDQAGFARLGTYDTTTGALGLYVSHRIIDWRTTIDEVWTAPQR